MGGKFYEKKILWKESPVEERKEDSIKGRLYGKKVLWKEGTIDAGIKQIT